METKMHDLTELTTRDKCISDVTSGERTTHHKNKKTKHPGKRQKLRNEISKILERLENIEGKLIKTL